MSPRKYASLLIIALLLTALLLIYFTDSMNWNWNRTDKLDGFTPVEPAGGQRIAPVSTDLVATVSLPLSEYSRLLKQNERFMLDNPHVNVQLLNISDDDGVYTNLLEQSAIGVAPDIMLIDNSWVIPLAVRGYLKPIDSLMMGDVLSDQLPGLLEPLKWNGYLWGSPNEVNPYVIAWNKDMLKEAGQSEPPSDWTAYQQMSDQLIAASPNQNGERFLVNFSPGDLRQLLLWTARFGTDRGELINMRRLSSQQQDKLLWLHSLPNAVSFVPLSRSHQLMELVREKRLLMIMLPWEEYNGLDDSTRDKLLIEKEAIYYPWLNGSSFVISSGSKSENEAMLWIQEMTNTVNGLEQFENGSKLPVRASLYNEYVKLLTKSGEKPPSWWLKTLGARTAPGDNLAQPDPDWPNRWQQWANAWKAASGETPKLDEFIEQLALH